MDPLGTILEAFANYFTPTFLAVALVIGYLMFFLFFYKTEYWDSVCARAGLSLKWLKMVLSLLSSFRA
jgi:hypothetical protein